MAESGATTEKSPEQSRSTARFEKNFPAFVQEVLGPRAAEDTRPVILMAEDAGRFGLMNTLRRCWAPKPLRPVVARQMVRESLYVFAAVGPQFGPMSALIFPYATSQMMTLFLAHVAAELADYFLVMLVDRAGGHLRHQVTLPDNIRVLPQLPGSPELNPAEHLWEDLRENETANHHFDTLELLEPRYVRVETASQLIRKGCAR